MYKQYFGLNDLPFSIAPDPRYLYMSERHRDALAHLVYGLNSDGAFILLTGEVGTGKTTVSRCLLEQIPENTNVALVLNPRVSALELLETLCDELHIQYPPGNHSIKTCVDLINHYLLDAHAKGRKTVVLIDEAQNLDINVLEQLRLLTNLETSERKLLQIILLGQPELLEILDRPELAQLAQRITARYHLTPLNEKELMSYVAYRLSVAGGRQNLFGYRVLKRLYRLSSGIPRLVNVICDRALLGTYVQNQSQVTTRTLDRAAREVVGDKHTHRPARKFGIAGWMSLLVISLGGVVAAWWYQPRETAIYTPVFNADVIANAVAEIEEEAAMLRQQLPEPTQPLQWADESMRLRSNSLAFQQLFQSWNLKYNPAVSGSPCYFAQGNGLDCMDGHASLEQLQGYNRPAVLELYDNEQRVYFAALLGLKGEAAILSLAGQQQTVSVQELQKHWFGSYTLLWQRPPVFETALHPGDQGQMVLWLSKKMNQINPASPLPEIEVYRPELIEKVRQFQLAQGLVADGVVGVQTLIYINNAVGHTAPVLYTGKS